MEEKNYKGDDFYREAFSRNFGVFTLEEQDKIRNSKIAIAGMGGVGGHYLLSFVVWEWKIFPLRILTVLKSLTLTGKQERTQHLWEEKNAIK